MIVRGKKVLPAALESFKRLVDSEGKFRIPTVFVTNAGNAMRHEKAKQLSSWLGIEVYKYCIIPSSFQYYACKISLCGLCLSSGVLKLVKYSKKK